MKKNVSLKWQLFIGVTTTYILIIGAAIYFFSGLGKQIDSVKVMSVEIQTKLNELNAFDEAIFQATQAKTRYFLDDVEKNITDAEQTARMAFNQLKIGVREDADLSREIERLEKAIDTFFDEEVIAAQRANTNDSQNVLIDEQAVINAIILRIRQDLIKERGDTVEEFHQSAETLKTRTYIMIGFLLLILLFILNRIVKTISELRQRSKETHLLNKEIKAAQKQIEDANWILTASGKLNTSISGIANEKDISKVAFETILDTIDTYAAALYVKTADSNTYVLAEHIGVDKASKLPEAFVEGEGLMGHVIQRRTPKVIRENAAEMMRSSSATDTNQIKTIILTPCTEDNETFGLLEIGGHYTDESFPQIIGYLERVAPIIAVAIKRGQGRTLVESLLAETQQQTEELEAQQEEMRITNEELTYKTNLLEASEEELRVQQEELQQSNTELEEKAKQLALRNRELNTVQKTVEEKIKEVELASKYKSEFMANMSHELRTPLNSILILAKLLQDNKDQHLQEEQVKYASVIHSAGKDLLQLINTLLDLAKIESGKVELMEEAIHTQELADNMEGLFATVAQKKDIQFGIHIQEGVAPTFICDEYRLEQILKNFLSNAFKFTDNNGKITLTITQETEQLIFSVSDTGKGIAPDKQQLIFEAFRQEDGSTSRKYGGTGLGLSISQEIALLLGGRITVASDLGKGSTFTLSIPYRAPHEATPPLEQPPTEKEPRAVAHGMADLSTPTGTGDPAQQRENEVEMVKTLLIVEDDINFAEILREFAMSYGFRVILAHNGADGIEKAQQFKPQAIILDVMLPVSDGWEVLRILKANPETKHIPIHMMSAANFNQREFIDKGAIGFLSKPVSEDALRKAFEHIQLNIKQGIKKVLLVEDQEFQSEVIKSAFAEHHIIVVQAFSAQSALHKLREEQNIDCIILDIQLPDGNGLDVLDQIKSMPAHSETPVIINTAHDLSAEQITHIQLHTKAMVLKSGKNNNRLIDEVTLFLNKISTEHYVPLKNIEKLGKTGQQPDSLAGKKVLVADDDMRNIFALTTALQAYNMEIEIANNGIEAVEIATQNIGEIDIVLMDIMMPEMDGYEAIEKIRRHKENSNLPIIAITAKAMKGDREKSIKVGASDYISKPIDMDKLISLMRVWLS